MQDLQRGGLRVLANLAAHLETADVGQLNVEHHEVRLASPDLLEGPLAGSRFYDVEADPPQHHGHQVARSLVVIDVEDERVFAISALHRTLRRPALRGARLPPCAAHRGYD